MWSKRTKSEYKVRHSLRFDDERTPIKELGDVPKFSWFRRVAINGWILMPFALIILMPILRVIHWWKHER
jgi:hypothetical protein